MKRKPRLLCSFDCAEAVRCGRAAEFAEAGEVAASLGSSDAKEVQPETKEFSETLGNLRLRWAFVRHRLVALVSRVFNEADEDGSGLLSVREFSEARSSSDSRKSSNMACCDLCVNLRGPAAAAHTICLGRASWRHAVIFLPEQPESETTCGTGLPSGPGRNYTIEFKLSSTGKRPSAQCDGSKSSGLVW